MKCGTRLSLKKEVADEHEKEARADSVTTRRAGVSSKDELENRKVLFTRPQSYIPSNCDRFFHNYLQLSLFRNRKKLGWKMIRWPQWNEMTD